VSVFSGRVFRAGFWYRRFESDIFHEDGGGPRTCALLHRDTVSIVNYKVHILLSGPSWGLERVSQEDKPVCLSQ
jgi:hypothetical protein